MGSTHTIISVLKTTKERFTNLKKEHSEKPEERDEFFLNELMDYVEENMKEDTEDDKKEGWSMGLAISIFLALVILSILLYVFGEDLMAWISKINAN